MTLALCVCTAMILGVSWNVVMFLLFSAPEPQEIKQHSNLGRSLRPQAAQSSTCLYFRPQIRYSLHRGPEFRWFVDLRFWSVFWAARFGRLLIWDLPRGSTVAPFWGGILSNCHTHKGTTLEPLGGGDLGRP